METMAQKNGTVRDVGEAARDHTGDAIEALRSVCVHGRDEAARVAAAVALLDLGHGNARQKQMDSRND